MKIGNVELENNVFLGPMAGVTDRPFRTICHEFGCGLVYSEMVSAKGIYYDNKNTKELLDIGEEEMPASIQLFGSEPEIMGEMAKRIENINASFVDINMGCPVPKVVKNGEGSALMKTPELAGEIINAMVRSQSKPVTVKIRKGFGGNMNAVEMAQIAEENGAAAIAVHGRTREEYYSGIADWDIIKEVKKAVSIPVIGNGDINLPQDAERMLDYTSCDAVMIARGARGNPWIFRRTAHYLKTGELLAEPSIEEKISVAMRHAKMLVAYKGEYIGVRQMRAHMAWYIKGVSGASALRDKINHAEKIEEIEELLESIH
ncbi:putative tRNA-dihydrouridine synthase [Clostridiales bacterium]|nr:putative tRNA-dihydrouridine synthase [Clostridiales bacterium]